MASRGDTIDKAIAMLASDEDVVKRLREHLPDSLEQLKQIACGNVPRNAQSILKAIETQLRFSQPLPKVTVEHQGSVGIAVIDPYAELPEGQEALPAPALPAARAVVPVAPIRRRPPAAAGTETK